MSRTLMKLYIRLLKEGYKVIDYRILSDNVLEVIVHRPGWDPPIEMTVFTNINDPRQNWH